MLTTIGLPALLVMVALVVGVREWHLYREQRGEVNDLFVYTAARLRRRMIGLVLLAVLAGLIATYESFGETPRGVVIYMCCITGVIGGLIVIAVLDARETAQAADPYRIIRELSDERRKRPK